MIAQAQGCITLLGYCKKNNHINDDLGDATQMPKIDPLIASSCSNTALSHLNVPNFLNLAITLSHVQDYRHILQKIGTYSKCADLQNICACRFCIIPIRRPDASTKMGSDGVPVCIKSLCSGMDI